MKKILYLEGLRGIAALIVLFGHLKALCFLAEEAKFYTLIHKLHLGKFIDTFIINVIQLSFNGEISVWIFWTLSSYVISILFFKSTENYDKVIIAYFSKRYIRLCIPVLFSVLLAYALLKFGLMYNKNSALQNGWSETFYLFEPNFFKAMFSALFDAFFNYKPSETYNPVIWTIQYEFLGSLFTFAIFGIIRHNSKRYILYFVILLVLLKLNLFWLCAFVVGHILSDYDFSDMNNKTTLKVRQIENKINKYRYFNFAISILLIVFNNFICAKLNMKYELQNLILSSFIVYMCLRNDIYKRIFSSKFPYWLGKLSFSFYLIHVPIICSLTAYLILINNTLSGKLFAVGVTMIVVFISAHFFTKYIDKQSVILANKIGDYFKQYS